MTSPLPTPPGPRTSRAPLRLKHRFLVLVGGVLVLSFLVTVLSVNLLLNYGNRVRAQKEIQRVVAAARDTLWNLEHHCATLSRTFVENPFTVTDLRYLENIKAVYQDPSTYRQMTQDVKRELGLSLKGLCKSEAFSELFLLDKSKELISLATCDSGRFQLYISNLSANGQPVFDIPVMGESQTLHALWATTSPFKIDLPTPGLADADIGSSFSYESSDTSVAFSGCLPFSMESSDGTKAVVGYLCFRRHLDQRLLAELEKKTVAEIALLSDRGHQTGTLPGFYPSLDLERLLDSGTGCSGTQEDPFVNEVPLGGESYLLGLIPLCKQSRLEGLLAGGISLSREKAQVRTMTFALILVGSICLLLAIPVTAFFAAKITTPLRQLTESALSFSGGPWKDIHLDTQDECRDLAQAFNTMGREVSEAMDRLKQSEGDLKESRRFLSTLLSNLPGMVYQCRNDRDWTMQFMSGGTTDLTGYHPMEFMEQQTITFNEITDPEDRDRIWDEVQRAVMENRPFDLIFRIHPKSGGKKWVWEQGQGVRSAAGELVYLEGFITDITKLKEAEEALQQTVRELQEREKTIRALIDAPSDAIHQLDPTGIILDCNEEMGRRFSMSREELIGSLLWDLFPPEVTEHRKQTFWKVLETGKTMRLEDERQGRWNDTLLTPILDNRGKVSRVVIIARDITQRKCMEDELRRARGEAESASLAKSRFLASMSHEIRTPLNAMTGMTSLLLDTPLDSQQRKFAGILEQASVALTRIVNDILDFSKIEAGKMDLDHHAFDVRICMDHVLKMMTSRAGEKEILLLSGIDPRVPARIIGDSFRLQQILLNLLSNAIKFSEKGKVVLSVDVVEPSPPESPLEVDAQASGGCTLIVSVSDTGKGIAEDRMHQLFQPFSQLDASMTRKHDGTGLGLAISRQLCEMMGGRIWVESKVGEGSTFFFTFRAKVAAPDMPEQDFLQETLEPEYDHGMAKRLPLNILLVEDNSINREVAQMMLDRLGYGIDLAGNGEEALEALNLRPYDVVLMDLQMPEMDGLEATRLLRQRLPSHRQPWVIALTANALEGDREACLAAGMDDFIGKPLRARDLIRALSEVHIRKPARELDPASGAEASPSLPSGPLHPIDPAGLDALRKLIGRGHPEVLPKLIADFCRDTDQLLKEARESLACGESKAFQSAAHTLKSNSRTFGATTLAELCLELETLARVGNLDNAGKVLEQAELEWERAKKALSEAGY